MISELGNDRFIRLVSRGIGIELVDDSRGERLELEIRLDLLYETLRGHRRPEAITTWQTLYILASG